MKATVMAAAAAALVGTASAANHRHDHRALFARGASEGETCVPGCTTIWTTITGAAGRT